jgi:hypothetical protein
MAHRGLNDERGLMDLRRMAAAASGIVVALTASLAIC